MLTLHSLLSELKPEFTQSRKGEERSAWPQTLLTIILPFTTSWASNLLRTLVTACVCHNAEGRLSTCLAEEDVPARRPGPDTLSRRYSAKYSLLPDVISMRNVLLCTTAVVFCLSFTPASAQQAISTPILASDANFRDLAGISASNGGTGFVNTTSNNGVMRTGVFYRSQALSILSIEDKETLSTLHIGLDIDLRTPFEINSKPSFFEPNAGPDWVPNGTDYLNVNIYGTPAPPSTASVYSPETAVAYMKNSYQRFVTDPIQRAKFHDVLIALANEADAALFHCSGGKDRTGWTAMLLQSIAGVSPTTIMNDYLASNSYMAAEINQQLDSVPPSNRATLAVMLGVQSEFLQAGLDQVNVSYGSLDAYLTQGLGLSQEDIYVLRNKMVYYNNLPGTLLLLL